MKYMNITVIILILFGCSPQKNGTVDLSELKEEVMDIHDEVMPWMGELRNTRKKLEEIADTLFNEDSVNAEQLRKLSKDIEEANEAMMQWMREFEPSFSGSEEEVRKYLQRQKIEIEEVKKKMMTSLEAGQKKLMELTK